MSMNGIIWVLIIVTDVVAGRAGGGTGCPAKLVSEMSTHLYSKFLAMLGGLEHSSLLELLEVGLYVSWRDTLSRFLVNFCRGFCLLLKQLYYHCLKKKLISNWSPIQTSSLIRCGAGSLNGWPGEWYSPIILKCTFAQRAVRSGFVGWFLSDWHLQLGCSRITVSGSPPSQQTASLLTLSLGQGVQTGPWQLVLRSGHPQPQRCGSTVGSVHPTL